ncbi:MAG: class I SAM-dependent methyltransferase [Alphaproteobacteria bacterium]|nr:MAG: class I SAM-dependent methyltransferase [Alphaproteobacteria bacterium]
MTPRLAKLAYASSQAARAAWFTAHTMVASTFVPMPARIPRGPFISVPSTAAVLRDLAGLFRRDWQNIQAGHYPLPWDLAPNPRRVVRQSRLFFADLPAVHLRRRTSDSQSVPVPDQRLPRYFRQAFHFQSDGYLSQQSAELYDTQVETLFVGGADAMRRQALPPLVSHLLGRSQPVVADVACGTGRFLRTLRQAVPQANLIAVDLSLPYLTQARRWAAGDPMVSTVQASVEALPLAGLDAITCIYLFHELPKRVRPLAAQALADALAPGGRLVFVDSIQTGDHPPYDGLLQRFSDNFHEPYHRDYCHEDLVGLFSAAGLVHRSTERAFFSKVMVFDRPGG